MWYRLGFRYSTTCRLEFQLFYNLKAADSGIQHNLQTGDPGITCRLEVQITCRLGSRYNLQNGESSKLQCGGLGITCRMRVPVICRLGFHV